MIKTLFYPEGFFMNQNLGKASVKPEQPVYILNSGKTFVAVMDIEFILTNYLK